MPELPEVETIKKILKNVVVGYKIIKIDVLRPNTILNESNFFISTLVNETFLDVTRRGKFLIFHLTNEKIILSHLRMEGKYYEMDEKERNSKYARVVFYLNNHKKICYDDSRCFGIMKLSTEKKYLNEKELKSLGKEPFDIVDVSCLYKKCKNKNIAIKSILLDQAFVSGLGNIYADECLFMSKIHPLTPGKNITLNQWKTLIENAKIILNDAIKYGGSTIKSYHPGKGVDGAFQLKIKAYGKKGCPCPNCKTKFKFLKINGRGTTYCPKCQKKTFAPLYVGITGKIGAGKSSVSKIFSEFNYKTIDADQIVHELYQNTKIVKQIERELNISFNQDVMNKEILRDNLLSFPENKIKLENIIHPLVIQKIKKFLYHNEKDKILVAEVPLLFESKMENLFDFIIAIDINNNIQLNRLMNRNKDCAQKLLSINQNNKFNHYIKKVDFIIKNNGDINDLKNQTLKIINQLKDCQN